MVKKFVKSMLTLGLLLSVPQFSIKADASSVEMVDFEAHLQPHDLMLLDQDGAMVYMSPDFIDLMKNFSSNVQEVKDLVDHVNLGYKVAPMHEVSAAVKHVMQALNDKSSEYAIAKNYEQALLNGDALVRAEDAGDRKRGKSGKFCTLFARCATFINLNVRNSANIGCNASVCGDLCVGGTVRACNFSFTGAGCTGCTGTSTFPNISACGNIQFNTNGTILNAQGAVEARSRLIRGTMVLSPVAGGVVLASAGVGTIVAVTGTPTALLNFGSGFSVGATSGAGFSSGVEIATVLPATGDQFYFAVDIQIPVTFNTAYLTTPTIFTETSNVNPVVIAATPGTAIVDANTSTVVQASMSNVTATGAIINLVFHVTAAGAGATPYTAALGFAQAAINNIITSAAPVNALLVNLLADGPVA